MESPRTALYERLPAWVWAAAAMAIAAVPLAPGFTGSRIFYIRDLSLYFWGRYLWLRRAWLSGSFPLWDPYVGAGQSAVADALHQMFLLPAIVVRLIGSEVLGFNLWVALPFPIAALGAWLFFRRRFSPVASMLGGCAFALCGPIYSTSNFPNMSWTVAAMPWMLLAADRLVDAPGPRRLAVFIALVGLQALAGEPVSFLATAGMVVVFAFVIGGPDEASLVDRVRRCIWVAAGLVAGIAMAAVQLIPMMQAAAQSERGHDLTNGLFWSLHPVALLETIAPRLFGDYFVSQSLAAIPWVPILNSGREPFFFSLYLGVPLLALTAFGFAAGGPKRWTAFWLSAGGVALVAAFGTYTPIYPFLRDHLPVLASFRFPAKYIVITAMAVAAGTAAGWEALTRAGVGDQAPDTRRGRASALTFTTLVAGLALAAIVACLVFATPTAFGLYSIARVLRSGNPVGAAEFMLKVLPGHASQVLLLALVTALLVQASVARRANAKWVQAALALLIVGDLTVHAWPINPTFDPSYMQEPEWLAMTRTDPNARFYVGGKRDGTLDPTDAEASPGYLNPPGLIGSASRAALSSEVVFYPSAFKGRELLSYDLAVLWQRIFIRVSNKFFDDANPIARERFLDRTGVRYRILPASLSQGHRPLLRIPYHLDSYLYDWGPAVAARASVVPRRAIVRHADQQASALFDPRWDAGTVLIASDPAPAGTPGAPVDPFARIAVDNPGRTVLEAGAGPDGGYLVLLDSFSDGWVARVDGEPAAIVRANGLFRALHLAPGRHEVEFEYRPAGLLWGATASVVSLALVMGLMLWPAIRRQRANVESAADDRRRTPANLAGALARD